MTEQDHGEAGTPVDTGAQAPSAGAMLRAAREQRGVHIAALAAAIKVPQRKLEALEGDRYDELPDLTFTRALAQSVCRTLKIDMQPVLDRLPHSAVSPKLEHVGVGLNAPFRDRPGREEPTDWSWVRKPVVWGTLLVLAGAAMLAFLPERWLAGVTRVRSPASAASAPMVSETVTLPASAVAPSTVTLPVEPPVAASAPASAPAVVPATPASAAVAAPSMLGVKANAESWIEVQDARGETLLSRSLAAGESVAVDGVVPLRVTIGNATATQLTFRGKVVDLVSHTRDNVARMQLN